MRRQQGPFIVSLMSKMFAIAWLCVLAIGCAAPIPSLAQGVAPTPTLISPASASPSSTASPAPSFRVTCDAERVLFLGSAGATADECSAILPFEAVAARLGTITRVFIKGADFPCGDLWLPRGSPPPLDCARPINLLGSAMSGWASFDGTDNVAAISVRRSLVDPKSPVAFGPWHASLEAFIVPPAGWTMPAS